MDEDIRRMKIAIKQQANELEKRFFSIDKKFDKKFNLLKTTLEENCYFTKVNAEHIDYLHALVLISLRTLFRNDKELKLSFIRATNEYLSNNSDIEPEFAQALDVIIKLANSSCYELKKSWEPKVIEGGKLKRI